MGIKRKQYEEALEPLTLELVSMARWAKATGARIVVLFEGRDTAGKGGAITAVRNRLNPRQCRTVALSKPSEAELTQWYFQRYVPHLPSAGEIVLFDRSWYNRAGVEKVMGYCTEAQSEAFLAAVPTFERLLVDDGILLCKYWLATDQAKQEERLRERLEDPLKRWKLSPVDLAARARYDDYTAAREAMLAATHTNHAPWTVVDFNDQRRGRLTLIRDLLDRVPDTHKDPPAIDFPDLGREPVPETYGVMRPIADYPLDQAGFD
ncbi:polyphosphate kinase 2 [Erythrobacter sanguineus]|uniref:ADP/GDP-polyphosphate phosphotransferase n=1 Tax=Erythrobacter sanguineus TaxID=198312 RepID=A0A1M7SKC1_9SPHN|nr:polyphosphate kinase 2 [Erythrobacter sanguineus]SHN58848.1 transcriptional regulator [Erythrobacter sanguineus]